jgi:hypothetical protein
MPPVSSPSEQPELFRSALVNLVDRRHPLVRLAGLIDWDRFATAFGPLYRGGVGRPGLPAGSVAWIMLRPLLGSRAASSLRLARVKVLDGPADNVSDRSTA